MRSGACSAESPPRPSTSFGLRRYWRRGDSPLSREGRGEGEGRFLSDPPHLPRRVGRRLKPAATRSIDCRPRIENARGLGVSPTSGGQMPRPTAATILTTALLVLACGLLQASRPPPRPSPRN